MSQLCFGRIVWVSLLDPGGRNLKSRPAVIVTPTEDIREDGDVWVVAISTQLDQAPKNVQVELPWHQERHPKTMLKGRCVAVCTWLAKISVASIQEYAGMVPNRHLLDIKMRLNPLP